MTEITAHFSEARKSFHAALLRSVLRVDDTGVASNADRHNLYSVGIAGGIVSRLGAEVRGARLAAQMSGNRFEEICRAFLENTFLQLEHLRPGTWRIRRGSRVLMASHEQYAHLTALEQAARRDLQLATALGSDYIVTPDIVITRETEDDDTINAQRVLVDEHYARLTSLRRINGGRPLLHASISCKWTIRSDRAQNSRTEALNLVRNRKGHLPHVVVVTGEPFPSRLASIALGTGDIDCVYHFALLELQETIEDLSFLDAQEMLTMMVDGKRLKDI
ncbi:MAG TPA: NgoMIV family type II restriction endonuclease, partial [Nitrososphaera sp.]